MDNYKYQVCTRCFTFNHESYINDALKGFAIQKTSFPIVFVIVDDASTDNTAAELLKFAYTNLNLADKTTAYEKEVGYAKVLYARHKTSENSFFAILLLKENHYSRRQSKLPYLTEWTDNSKYMALCEGDDYWTDSKKLQTQVDFLENHDEVSLCFHPVRIEGEDIKFDLKSKVGYSNINDLCFGNYIATGSVVCRNDKRIEEYNKMKIKKSRVGDYQMFVFYALLGDFYSFKKKMSVYRVHADNSWRGSSLYAKKQDYDGYLYNLIHIGDMPSFPRFILKIRYLINKIVINDLIASEKRDDDWILKNNKAKLHTIINKTKRVFLSLVYNVLKILESLKYRFINIIRK